MKQSNNNQSLLHETAILIEKYLKNTIDLGKLTEKFDQLYYSHNYDEKVELVDFMEKLSSTTSDYHEAMSPESSCMIYEERFKEYANDFLQKLRKKLGETQ